jgi:hypothetical protein
MFVNRRRKTMHRHSVPQTLLVLLALLPAMLACNFVGQMGTPTQAPVQPAEPPAVAVQTAAAPALPTSPAEAQPAQPSPARAGAASGPIRQWAAEAQASSEYGSSDWAAFQATGAPNTPVCGDSGTAWAAYGQDTLEWINLFFKTPVVPTEIRIVETYNPDQVVLVDLIDMQGQYIPVYTGQPSLVDSPCPFTLTVPVKPGSPLVQGVRITVDQTVRKNWNEIDAVESVGAPGEGTPVRPVIPTP